MILEGWPSPVRLQLGKLWTGEILRWCESITFRHFNAPSARLCGKGLDETKGVAGESPAGCATFPVLVWHAH